MKYSIISGACGPIKRHSDSERYFAAHGRSSGHVPWRRSINARDAGGMKCQFKRSAKLPVRDGMFNSP